MVGGHALVQGSRKELQWKVEPPQLLLPEEPDDPDELEEPVVSGTGLVAVTEAPDPVAVAAVSETETLQPGKLNTEYSQK